MTGPPPYDGTPESRRAHAAYLAEVAADDPVACWAGPLPTAAQLEKHARRFGPDQVAETAADAGIEVDVSDIPAPRRPRRRRR